MKAKKITQSIFAVLLAISLLAGNMLFSVSAAESDSEGVGEQSGDFEYELSEDGTASITGYTGAQSSLDIPSELDGYKVTEIAEYAFSDCRSLKNVTIFDSVLKIGSGAFSGCITLESITIPNSVTSIGGEAFFACTSLKSVTIPNSITTISSEIFRGCTSLESVTIPDSVTQIGMRAFDGCTALKSITIPKSVTNINWGVFMGCTSLESINVESISANYSSLDGVLFNKDKTELIQYPAAKANEEYSISSRVVSIASCAFWYCNLLESISVDRNNKNYAGEEGVLFNKDKTKLIQYPAGKTSIEYLIPNTVMLINAYAFSSCSVLERVTVPNSVTDTGISVFSDCTSLKSISISNSITEISADTFTNCTSLESVIIPDSVTEIGDYAFINCSLLKSVTIPDSVTSIWNDTFLHCTSLTSVTIPDSVTLIGARAFGYIDWNNKVEGFTIYGTAGSEAENYATENGFVFMDVNSVEHKDDSTGISVTAKADADLNVSKITDEQSISDVNRMLAEGENVVNFYDISLVKDGEKVQPEGIAEVKIPCDNKNAKVYRVEADNTLTEMNSYYQDGFIVFHTEHFSLYIVAEVKTEIIGDMNKDGKIDVTDVTAIQIGLAKSGTEYYDVVADIDKDGKVTVTDVTLLQQFIAGSITEL